MRALGLIPFVDRSGDEDDEYRELRYLYLQRQVGSAPLWSPIVYRKNHPVYGDRHFLDRKPIHCGMGLELQDQEIVTVAGDDVTKILSTGIRVRFEIAHNPTKHVVLYTGVGGYDFQRRHEPWMRFRWPRNT